MNISIILTTTVNVNYNKSALFQVCPQERINTYIKSIKLWLEETFLHIIVVENSGYKFEELAEYLVKYNGRFEIITFNEYENPDSHYLINHKSKGMSELFSIRYALNNSNIIKNTYFVIKITGRYFVKDFEKFLSIHEINDIDCLTQYDNTRCEIIGVHIKHINDIFAIKDRKNNLIIYDDHIEIYYKNKIAKYPNVLTCEKFTITPTQRGGLNEIWDNL